MFDWVTRTCRKHFETPVSYKETMFKASGIFTDQVSQAISKLKSQSNKLQTWNVSTWTMKN